MSPSELSLGWNDFVWQFESNSRKDFHLGWRNSEYRLNSRRLKKLQRVFQVNTSIDQISLGWRVHHRDPHVLARVLEALPLQRLTFLRLELDEWAPSNLLISLLRHQTQLETLQFTSMQAFRRSRTGNVCCPDAAKASHQVAGGVEAYAVRKKTVKKKARSDVCILCDHNIVTTVLVPLLRYQSFEALKALKLEDCNMTDETVQALADWTYQCGGLDSLSLRNNRDISPSGLSYLCQANVRDDLDLSICDIDMVDAKAIATGISLRTQVLGYLRLSGNFRMDTDGILSLVEPRVCQKIVSLDVSFCEIYDYRARALFKQISLLVESDLGKITLRHLVMQGTRISSQESIGALCRLIRSNTPLQSLDIHDQSQPRYLSTAQVRELVQSLSVNWSMERFDLDWRGGDDCLQAQKDSVLLLNRSGRCIFREPIEERNVHRALKVIEMAGMDTSNDNLYQIVRKFPLHVIDCLRRGGGCNELAAKSHI